MAPKKRNRIEEMAERILKPFREAGFAGAGKDNFVSGLSTFDEGGIEDGGYGDPTTPTDHRPGFVRKDDSNWETL